MRRFDWLAWMVRCSALLLTACATQAPPGIGYDNDSGLFSVHAQGVSRGALLDQLAKVAHIEVRPQPARDETLTLDADGLDLDELLARLMPGDMHYIARRGDRELVSKVPGGGQPKQGPEFHAAPDLLPKGKGHAAIEGPRKAAADAPENTSPVRAAGPNFKADVRTLMVSEKNEPKKPLAARVPSGILRVTLLFEQGSAPKVLAAQNIEGGPPMEHLVRGPFLFLLRGADGGILQYGSFEDPLEEHSYLEQGEHSIGRAKSGIAGISLDNSKLAGARLEVIDARGLTLPRELNDESVRAVVERSKPVVTIPASQLQRATRQESAQ